MNAIPYACAAQLAPALVQRLVRVESGANPLAIGVVGARLLRQPRDVPEALATVRRLEEQGANYSVGISQVNRYHFARLGWRTAMQRGFDACANLRAGAAILQDCFLRARARGLSGATLDGANPASRAALSCYYSGDFFKGERLGYVARIAGKLPSVPAPATRPPDLPLFD